MTERAGKPLVSVVTIVFNGEKYIEQTILSVVTQSYENIEYIVVDGGSTDRTINIIKTYESKISKWISEPDEGISDAMNKGIRMSSGDIVGIIHSDDFYADPTVIGQIADVFNRSPEVKALYGIQDFIDPVTGTTLLTWGRDTDPSEIKKRMYIPHPTLFVRRKVYDEIGLFRLDFKVAMDYEFAIRLTKYTRPSFLNYKIACMRDTGTSGRQYRKAFRESVRALTMHGYYFSAAITVLRNAAKQVLIGLGFKRLLYRLWEKNVSPR
ncbi:MAG: glycosyltransferase family 2 protein [Thermodesulfovibrionales bacterium]